LWWLKFSVFERVSNFALSKRPSVAGLQKGSPFRNLQNTHLIFLTHVDSSLLKSFISISRGTVDLWVAANYWTIEMPASLSFEERRTATIANNAVKMQRLGLVKDSGGSAALLQLAPKKESTRKRPRPKPAHDDIPRRASRRLRSEDAEGKPMPEPKSSGTVTVVVDGGESLAAQIPQAWLDGPGVGGKKGWNKNKKHQHLTLLGPHDSVAFTTGCAGYGVVLGKNIWEYSAKSLPWGWKAEVLQLGTGGCSVGVAPIDLWPLKSLRNAPGAYVYHCSGEKRSKRKSEEYGPAFDVGDIVGVQLRVAGPKKETKDDKSVTLSFTLNGTDLGSAHVIPLTPKLRLAPAVQPYMQGAVRLRECGAIL
jgi:hypothetical protein